LQNEGVELSVEAFDRLLGIVEEKRVELLEAEGG
jgi:hypothetical protein